MSDGRGGAALMTVPKSGSIATVTLNPAIDQTAAIPQFTPDAVNRVAWEQADAGGKGVNVASFLADLGCAVSVTGFLGQDNPDLFQKLFQQKGITDRFVRVPGKTRVNVKIVDEIQSQVTDINFPGQPIPAAALPQLEAAIDSLCSQQDWFVLSGSLPEGVPISLYHDRVKSLKDQGKSVALDTSGPALRHALPACPDLIKPNIVELRELLGQPLDSETALLQAAQELIQTGIRWVVVSMGAEGAWFVDETMAVHAQPGAIEVKSTVGAGDAMVAGTVFALAQGKSLEECARWGTACSMGALTQIGPRLPPLEEIRAHADRVQIRASH